MKIITADIFLKHWLLFSKEKTNSPTWIKHWNTSTSWSNHILGTKTSSSDKSEIGNYFAKHFTNPQLRYRTEDGLFDLTMSLGSNYKAIPTLDKHFKQITFEPNEKDFYPPLYDIILEHENEIYYSWHEVYKLACVRSFLKVLVTYNSENISDAQVESENKMMVDTFQTIISQTNSGFAENSQTEYLLLIGREKDRQLLWSHTIFNDNGQPKK